MRGGAGGVGGLGGAGQVTWVAWKTGKYSTQGDGNDMILDDFGVHCKVG